MGRFVRYVPVAAVLFLAAACGENVATEPDVPTGTLEITTSAEGPDPDDFDRDGYDALLDGGAARAVPVSGTVEVGGLEGGSLTVELTGVRETCTVEGDNPRDVEIVTDETTAVEFVVRCVEVLGNEIVFFSGRDNLGLFSMNPDGSEIRRIHDVGSKAVISPDGTQVAYGTNDGVVILDADGTNVHTIAEGDEAWDPSWSPDGERLTFTRNKDIHTVRADGSDMVQLTNGGGNEDPTWSPTGDWIAYRTGAFGTDWQLAAVSPDGGAPVEVTDGTGTHVMPDWSPDGSSLIFVSGADNGGWNVATIGIDGSDYTVLTDGLDAAYPNYSPDGSRIVFEEGPHLGQDIYVMNADGTGMTQLTDYAGFDTSPNWSPVE